MSNDQVRDELDDAEDFYADVVHSLDGIVWEADGATFQFLFVSRQAETILGYPVREWLEDPDFWRRHTHPDDIEWCARFCHDATTHGRNHRFDYRMIAADGRVVWLRDIVTVQPRRDGSKRLVGIMLDVTEQKRAEADRQAAEEHVKRREDWFRRLIEHSWDTTCVVDREGTIVFVSPSVSRVLGHDPGELEGLKAFDLAVAEDSGRFRSFLVNAFDVAATGHECEYRARHKDGSERVLETFAGKPHQDDGREVVILNTRDVTEKKVLEAQLLTSQKMEAVGLLAGGIAHDFNNLLTVIRGYAETLPERMPPQTSCEEIEEIKRAADRATVLTQQLLAFSRKQIVRPATIDLNGTIAELSNLLARLIGENIELQIRTSDELLSVVADPGQVEQVLMNVAVNARDAMPSGGVLTIETGTATVGPSEQPYGLVAGRYATVTISDTGSGIAPEILSRIFDPFFSTKPAGKGTGLGLSTAFGIMQQAHGRIEVRSEVGRGSAFTLYFPESGEPVQPRRAADVQRPATGTETILVVEDEAAVRRLVVRVLMSNGYHVLTAANGAEALETCRSHDGDVSLLITDVVMPGMSGPELVDRLAAIRPRTRVIYMSGYAGDAVSQLGITEARVRFLAKPFTPPVLLARVREALDDDSVG